MGSSLLLGICVEKLQVEKPPDAPASTAVFVHPFGPKGLPATGVPNAVRVNVPDAFGPAVLYGSQMPLATELGSSLKLPWRICGVGTVNTWLLSSRCRIWASAETKKNVLFFPL